MSRRSNLSKQERVVIIGYGRVGQANALALCKFGYEVFYFDLVSPRLHYADEHYEEYEKLRALQHPLAVESDRTWYVVCVGDKIQEDGTQDISLISQALMTVNQARERVILRSTVLAEHLPSLAFAYYVPEFLHEKNAVQECIYPFYFVVGKGDGRGEEPSFFKDWEVRAQKVFRGTPGEAAYIKYLTNVWNALRIAFVNECGDMLGQPRDKLSLGEIEKIIDFVFEGKNYLRYGKSFAGQCLPKDVRAFSTMSTPGRKRPILEAIYMSNILHKKEVEDRYETLPEWFSFWEYGRWRGRRGVSLLWVGWETLNRIGVVRSVRTYLSPAKRQLHDLMDHVIPNRTPEKIRALWNKLAEKNARYYVNTKTFSGEAVDEFEFRETGEGDYKRYIVNDELLDGMVRGAAEKRALDLGCGIGRITEFLAKDFREVYGVDIAPAMIASAQKRTEGYRNVFLTVNDGVSLPHPNGFFDFTFSYLVFQHFPDAEFITKSLGEVYRTLKEGGIAKIQLRTGPGIPKWRWSYGVSVTPEEARILAEDIGFRVLKHDVESIKNLWVWLEK